MTPRSFCILLIKVIGLWLIMEGFSLMLNFFSYFVLGTAKSWHITAFIISLGVLYLLALRVCLFQSEWLVDKLKLDRQFKEERFEFKLHHFSVISMASMIIGALIMVDSIPQLIRQVFVFNQQKSFFNDSPATGWIIFYAVKSLLGFLLFTGSRPIAAYLGRRSKPGDLTGS